MHYPQTSYENDLSELNVLKENKSFRILNDLIVNLLPCLESKDIVCIKKYIVQPEDIYKSNEEGCLDFSVEIPQYEFAEADIPRFLES